MVADPLVAWNDIMLLRVVAWKKKSLQAVMCKLCWGAAVYHLWRQRNDIRHGKAPKTEEKLLLDVVWDVKYRIRSKGTYKKSDLNVKICTNWGLTLDILY